MAGQAACRPPVHWYTYVPFMTIYLYLSLLLIETVLSRSPRSVTPAAVPIDLQFRLKDCIAPARREEVIVFMTGIRRVHKHEMIIRNSLQHLLRGDAKPSRAALEPSGGPWLNDHGL